MIQRFRDALNNAMIKLERIGTGEAESSTSTKATSHRARSSMHFRSVPVGQYDDAKLSPPRALIMPE